MDEAKVFEMLGELNERTKLIYEQALKTNGRVTCAEGRINELEAARDVKAGEKKVLGSISSGCWDVGKIMIGGLTGAFLALLAKGACK